MAKKKIGSVHLHVSFYREGKMFVAYSPALDLSTCGKSFVEAKKNFIEIVNLFFEECIIDGTLHEVLESCGWQKTNDKNWIPPVHVAEENIDVAIPEHAFA